MAVEHDPDPLQLTADVCIVCFYTQHTPILTTTLCVLVHPRHVRNWSGLRASAAPPTMRGGVLRCLDGVHARTRSRAPSRRRPRCSE
jgi:hypothetical protein